MSRDLKVALAVLLPLAVAAVALGPLGSRGRQHDNMAIAQEELPRVQTALHADPRFKDVQAFVYTGQDGAVGLTGTVETDDDLFRLMKAVAAERLRVAVSWQVKVLAHEP